MQYPVRPGAGGTQTGVSHARAPATVIVAMEQELVRDAIAALIEKTGRYSVGGCGRNGIEAWNLLQQQRPAVAVLDLALTGLDSLEVIQRAHERGYETRSIVVTERRDRKTVLETLRAGAAGYVLRSGPSSHLLDALDQVRGGGIYLSPVLEPEKLFGLSARRGDEDPLGQLSTREYQVFQLLVDGVRAKEIANRLDLSPKTVDSHRASLMRKLDIHDVAGLVKFAVKRNLTAAR